MLTDVSLVLGMVATIVVAIFGAVGIGVKIGGYVKREEFISEMEKIKNERAECQEKHDYQQEHFNTNLSGIPQAFVSKPELDKHETSNNKSFDLLIKTIDELRREMAQGFKMMDDNYIELQKVIIVLQTRDEDRGHK